MPFYGGTKRVLLGVASAPVFLPNAGANGPFFDQTPVNVNTLSNLTISSNGAVPSSRRASPLKYNALTINASRTWTISISDSGVFIWANIITVNGTINGNGNDGGTAFDNTGANGGAGSGGGGGGGGGTAGFACCIPVNGNGGNGEPGFGGDDGGDSFTIGGCCFLANGGGGGAGFGDSNYGSDGYNYSSNLLLDPQSLGLPFGYGGNGGAGDSGGGGGGGGGAGDLQIYVCNTFNIGAAGLVTSKGGNPGLNGSENLIATQGDGGCIAILAKHMPVAINGKYNINGNTQGAITVWKINSDNTITQKLTTDTW